MNFSGEKTSQTLDLNQLFPLSLTQSGSFDLRRIQYNSFESVLQALSIPTLLVGRSHTIELANDSFISLANNLDPVGLKFSSLFLDNKELEHQQWLEHAIAERKHHVKETILQFGDKTVWVRMHLRTIRLATDHMLLVQIENLTAEKELSMSQKYKNLINIFPIGVAEFAPREKLSRNLRPDELWRAMLTFRLVDANTEFAKMHGHRYPDTLVGLTMSQFFPDIGKSRRLLAKWVNNDFQTLSFERKEKSFGRPSSNFENTLILNANDQAMLGIWWLKRDISERKRIEREMLRAQKLDSLGLLAGGIAHDFNNLLTAILGNISLGLSYSDVSPKSLERFQAAISATNRARDLTNQLLTFSKGGAPLKKPGSLADLLKECAGFILRGSKIRCKCSISNNLWAVDMDQGQISQVVNNLLINAVDAMPNGGVVLVRATNADIPDNDKIPLKKGKYVKASITDKGCGIRKEIAQKIFDPYFTTKKKGSGLGLSTSYFIIKKHGGMITVRSKVGVGTTFQFFLPATSSSSNPSEETEKLSVGAGGRILFMDDDVLVRDIAVELLSSLGYEVTPACDGEEALELCKAAVAQGRLFDVAILDLTVPGAMGGEETAPKMLEIDSSLRIIASSGYANSMVMSDYASYGFTAILPKPYDAKKLAATVGKVIANNPPGHEG
ncbi:hybrid sensor histidine kinase/response regulator [Desulfomonile tiedjei]|uniref:histidine kinase n=1 Tax=Desulfomonile tiedjei (strain ATCC 49306 / DSM 6799 / DCB-1) TaxID=706587 RepID=I4C9H1_DESTA|nr:ATP-binding protein [Desulfomonile tiedjei]AFM26212.1 signal transduction histidine kinase [Desulfomonile tiedjei DSM 6799]